MASGLSELESLDAAGPSTIENHNATDALLLLSEQAARLKVEDSGHRDVGVILQSLCHLHRWSRTSNDLHIYERSDRLRSIRLGIAAAHGRLRAAYPDRASVKGKEKTPTDQPSDTLESLLEGLTIRSSRTNEGSIHDGYPFAVTSTSRRLSLLSQAVTLAHGSDYASRLTAFLAGVAEAHASLRSEVPEELSQGDLYLCDQSLSALEGALGACVQAVDEVCGGHGKGRQSKRFVSVRPPGHHCESETPMGFCWLNNVAVAASHGSSTLDSDERRS